MAHDNPDIKELITTVREFIEEITGQLEGQARYHALCASFLLEVVERELAEWRPGETQDDVRLKAMLGTEAPQAEVLTRLCAKIRQGSYKSEDQELFLTLLKHVEAKINVIKPKHFEQYKDQ